MNQRARRLVGFVWFALMVVLGYHFYTARFSTTGPIVFRNASVTTSTGFVQQRMTVAIAGGRIAFVGRADDSIPTRLLGARHIDALGALVSAATFDPTVPSPLDALRHTWVGQIFVGAPGDVVISSYTAERGRYRTPVPRDFLGAVVGGRYYTAADLQPK